MAESPRPRRSAGTWFQSLYVRVLLRLLPHLINVFKHASPKIRAEVDYLEPGYTFMLSVNGTDLACACRRTASGSFKRVPPAAIASDVEPGSNDVSILDGEGNATVTNVLLVCDADGNVTSMTIDGALLF